MPVPRITANAWRKCTPASVVAAKLLTNEDSRDLVLASAVGELVSRTDKDSNASTDEDSNELHKTPLIEITVAIRNTAEL